MAITINSPITNLLPASVAFRGPLPQQKQQAKGETGSISPPENSQRYQVNSPAPPLYTRKDARGQQSSPATPTTPNTPLTEQPPETNSTPPGASNTDKEQQSATDSIKKPSGEVLSKAEVSLLHELQKADRSVRAHEMAHLAAAGGYAKGGASFSYQRGPDGQNYAIGGEVQVDTSKEASPSANIKKMQIIRQAALAPADPSPQDQAVAAQATLQIAESSKELQLAQTTLSKQPATTSPAEKNIGTVVNDVKQTSPLPLDLETSPNSAAKPKKNYAAYLNPLPPANDSNRQNVYRIA